MLGALDRDRPVERRARQAVLQPVAQQVCRVRGTGLGGQRVGVLRRTDRQPGDRRPVLLGQQPGGRPVPAADIHHRIPGPDSDPPGQVLDQLPDGDGRTLAAGPPQPVVDVLAPQVLVQIDRCVEVFLDRPVDFRLFYVGFHSGQSPDGMRTAAVSPTNAWPVGGCDGPAVSL